jgi:predicted nucleotidyltransferase
MWGSDMSSKDGYVKTSIPMINALFKFKIFIVLSNWIFQGMLYADKTERSFRLLLDGLMTLILYAVFTNFIPSVYIGLTLSFLVAHTVNWIFNGQLFVLGRYLGIKPKKQNEFCKYINELKYRAEREKSIQLVAVYGSLSRKELTESSDLDVRIIRKTGLLNGLKACLFGFSERTRALFDRFPLDLYIIDSKDHLSKIRDDETAILVYDASKRVN